MSISPLPGPGVTVVIPCRDEAASLPGVLRAMPPGYHVIVVDNGSRDDTAGVAASLGATVVHEPRPGYGAAVHRGIEASRARYTAVLDGDGSMDPRELPALVEAVRDGADLVVGRRRPTSKGSWPWHARGGNLLIAALIRRRLGINVHDIGAMRVARTQALLDLGITDRRFGYPLELLVRAARAGWVIRELDITYRPRTGGESKVSGSVIGTTRAARDFLKALA
ncbi:glycosyltransferase family 2 protein [Lolliginicoccus suaedae]|uniref:glycosyltransferase family 2 protein n=1 Tax=Lolliginicoccus suaedae TaxID=2605429 RepID=UPI0011F00980|nr:glycosyltransferase family 2 protein [Lolliginicoccus suaedae]